MKHTNNYTLKRAQIDEVMRLYRECAPHCTRQEEAFEMVAKSPASRFYISTYDTYRKIKRMLEGDMSSVENLKSETRRRLWKELYTKVCNELRSGERQKLSEVVKKIITSPAESIYLSPRQVGRIYYNTRKKRYDERGVCQVEVEMNRYYREKRKQQNK